MSGVDQSGRLALSPEVPAKPQRRKFTAKFKLRILELAEACAEGTGERGKLLRKHGLYSSHLSKWEKQRKAGMLAGLEPKKRGRKAEPSDRVAEENERLRRENARLQQRLEQAEVIIEVQKKLSTILGMALPTDDDSGSTG